MIEHVIDTGTSGQLRVQDYTDTPSKMTVEMYVKSSSPVSVPQLPWAWSIDGERVSWRAFDFKSVITWQYLGHVYVGSADQFILHLGGTNTAELAGPTDLSFNLAGGSGDSISYVHVKLDGIHRRAIPYVNDEGVWKQAQPLVRTVKGWVDTT